MIQITILGIQLVSNAMEYLLLHPHATELVLPVPISTAEAQNIATLLYAPTQTTGATQSKNAHVAKTQDDAQSTSLSQNHVQGVPLPQGVHNLTPTSQQPSAHAPFFSKEDQNQEKLATMGLLLAEAKKNNKTHFSPLNSTHSYAFLATLITTLGAQVTAVHITHVLHDKYQAQILINQAGTLKKIPCSLVEAVCLALQCEVNMYCFKNLLQYGKDTTATLQNLPRSMRLFAEHQIARSDSNQTANVIPSEMPQIKVIVTSSQKHPQIQIKSIRINKSGTSVAQTLGKEDSPADNSFNDASHNNTLRKDTSQNSLSPKTASVNTLNHTSPPAHSSSTPLSPAEKKHLSIKEEGLVDPQHNPFLHLLQAHANIIKALNINPSAIPIFSLPPKNQYAPMQTNGSKEEQLSALLQMLLPESDNPM